MIIDSTLKSKLIYIFGIADEAHKGCLKIGEATLDEDCDLFMLPPNCDALNNAARLRINQYTQTAGIEYQLMHTELAIRSKNKTIQGFNDKQVHDVLLRSGIKRKNFNIGSGKASEWFYVDLETAKAAIKAVKEGKSALEGHQISNGKTPFILRKEQRDAIDKTKIRYAETDQMLWNAKMRFGKTVTALQLFKELAESDPHYRRMLILTHRPVVDKGWFEDFGNIYYESDSTFRYGSKNNGDTFSALEAQMKKDKSLHYVYFASMQDLRGSSFVGGKFQKNDELFSAKWDMLVIDEAHEGTQTELGDKVIKALVKKGTKVLSLSGTPFNLFGKYKQEDIYTWSYVDEQREKENWARDHEGDHNPYADLPRMNMFTYDLGEHFDEFQNGEYSFNFSEFFRVGDDGEFVHKQHVRDFLDMLCDDSESSNYPFSNDRYRSYFRHTLWMIPGVKEGLALQHMLDDHPIFGHGNFNIANVAGDGDPEDPNGDALQAVTDAITEHPEDTYSITLSCGKLTTGVTVKPWTAVFMLSGTAKTGAATYMQTIFRVQSAGNIGGKQKTEAYVFDFAPDRVLNVMANAAKANTRPGKATEEQRKRLRELLNYFPVIALQGSQTRRYDVDQLLTRLKHAYVERVVNSGFDNNSLYNDRLLELDDVELQDFEDLKADIGSTPAMDGGKDIIINDQGLDDEDTGEKPEPKKKVPLSEEEKAARKEKKKRQDQRKAAISILRGISIRMPMLIYGAELKKGEDMTIDNFTDHIDPRSWEEFMPKDVTKQRFNNFKKYYDPEIFLEAGRKIREKASLADGMRITERIRHITQIFDTFRNPDKETVLTPWRVVNMHLSDCIGGFDFFDVTHTEKQLEPRFVDHGAVTNRIFMSEKGKILELNSKSGLYPLYMAYSMWRERCREWERQGFFEVSKMTLEEEQIAWDDVVQNNIFVICKTPMAVSITRRTLVGFRNVKTINARYYPNLIEVLKSNPDKFIEDIALKPRRFWGNSKLDNNMKFNAIVGNPPYQMMDGGNSNSAIPVFNSFVDVAKLISPSYISLIMPARWYVGGRGLASFRETMLNDKRLRVLFDYEHSSYVFPGVDIAGGVCFWLWNRDSEGLCSVTNRTGRFPSTEERSLSEFPILIRQNKDLQIVRKIKALNINNGATMDSVVSPSKPFGLRTFYKPQSSGTPCWFIQKYGKQYANPKDYTDEWNLKDKWKVLVPRSPIAGQTDFSKPVGFYYDANTKIAEPGEICTESLIVVFASNDYDEVISFKSYLYTKIVRFLLLQAVVSQDVIRSSYCFVPALEKYEGKYTDERLRKEWNISETDWQYIDSRIKAIEEMGK